MSPIYHCDSKIVCRCLKITEADIIDAVESGQLQSVQDVVQQTGAGDGCTACRRTILEYVLNRRNAVALGECG